MLLIVDDKIPYLRGYAEQIGEVRYIKGSSISPEDVRHADALIVRTRTHVDETLLRDSSVKIVVTATIGYDHLDTRYLESADIAWYNCPGCNAGSVAQYMKSSLLLLAAHGAWRKGELVPAGSMPVITESIENELRGRTIGIIGVGHVGTEVARMAKGFGMRILLCDPPLQEAGAKPPCSVPHFMNLRKMLPQCDIVTLHTPLTVPPTASPTLGMANEEFFSLLKPGAVFFNTSRGEVVCEECLLASLESERLRAAVIDTWQNEPDINPVLLARAFLSTPHIAGYSADGKANGSRRALALVARHFGMSEVSFSGIQPPALPSGDYAYFPEGNATVLHPALRLYDPTRDSLALKGAPETFERLRGNYPLRREM